MTKDQRDGLLLILLAASGYAFMPTLVKTIYAHSTLEAMDVALWRFIFATPLIWLMVTVRSKSQAEKSKEKMPVKNALILGFIFSWAALTAFLGLELLPASTYVVLFYTYPAMVVILSSFLGEPIQKLAWIALGMALFGVMLTVPDFTEGALDMLGVVFSLVNAAVVAIYYLVSKRIFSNVTDVFRATGYTVTGALCTLLVLIPMRGIQIPPNIETWLSLIAIASFCTIMPVFSVNQGIQKIGSSQAALISTVEPVLSMAVAVILLSEIILPIQWLGAGLIIASVILLQMRPPRKA